MRKAIALVVVLTCAAGAALAALDEMSFARRVTCEVQEPTGTSLERLTFQQGTTPLVDLYVLRRGRPIATDTTVTARLVFGASATAAVYAVSTNYAVTNNSYLVQLPTIGTNSAAATNGLWWYTVYFDRAGQTFWTGNGELVIEKTTSTADGTVWQEITTSAAVSEHNTNGVAHADIRAMTTNATDVVARSHLTESSNTVHGGFIRVAYDWATNAYSLAQTAFGWGNHATNGYVTASVTNGLVGAPTFQAFTGTVLTAESDPVWTAVSNTVTQGAALGATALQGEYDPVLLAWELAGRPGVVTAETDPIAGAVAGILKGDGFGGLSAAAAGVDYLAMEYDVLAYPVATNAENIVTGHVERVDNPHTVTAAQVGAVSTSRTITVNGATGTLDSNVTFTVTGSTDAPAWIAATNTELAITITNDLERPQYLYATGAVSLAFAGLRPPQPFYLVVRGPDSLAFPSGTHFVGGASWQTNQANHFIVWQYSTNLYVNPVTTSTEN